MPEPDITTHSVADPFAATGGISPSTAPLFPLPAWANRYKLGDEIARGGMGVVFRATDTVLGREVAVKVLQEKFSPASGAAFRFADEARIAAQLQHPGIPPVHDLGNLPDGRPYLAMKLIKGRTLDGLLAARLDSSMERGHFVATFEKVCHAIAYAHSHKVIHRDLKPANVMVGNFGEVQVMDWGLAKVLGTRPADVAAAEETANSTAVHSLRDSDESFTQAGSVLGTPAFMPPEQALGAINKIDARSDVFGLGAILAVILTGKPPFAASSAETTRIQSAQGNVADCFARLDECGADPDLVALCKRCLSPKSADRPADARVVATAVSELRSAADERARRAELDRVRLEGVQAAAQARSAERRKRRQLWIGAATLLAIAAVGGLLVVLAVQRQANADLAKKNAELADEQTKVQDRFDLAQKAIATFHTGVSEDLLLSQPQFKELRDKLLKAAAGFYGELMKLLDGQTDVRSRHALAAGCFQLGELTEKIGAKQEALVVHRKALTIRRELAEAVGANVVTRLDVIRSLRAVGRVLHSIGDLPGAMSACEEQRDLAAQLLAEEPTDAISAVLAQSHNNIGIAQWALGKPAQALAAHEQALSIRQKLADSNPASSEFQSDLAKSHYAIGFVLSQMKKPAASLAAYEHSRDIWQKLAQANPTATEVQNELARSLICIGNRLSQLGKPNEAMKANNEALAIQQKLAADFPAVTNFQRDLAFGYSAIGLRLSKAGKVKEALAAHERALAMRRRLADANPDVTDFQSELFECADEIGDLLLQSGSPEEALKMFEHARDIAQKLVDAHPGVADFESNLAVISSKIGTFHLGQKRFADALTALNQGVAFGQKLSHDHPDDTQYLKQLGLSYANRGLAKLRIEQPAEAAMDLQHALELIAKVPTQDLETKIEKARVLTRLAILGANMKSGVTAAESAVFADQAVAALREAVKAGWTGRDELSGPDFDHLRVREDFRKLMVDVDARVRPNVKQGDK